MSIARERTIVKLAVAELSKFLDYLLSSVSNGVDGGGRFRVLNLLTLSYKYLADFPQISFLTSDIARFILNRQYNRGKGGAENITMLEGAWCELELGGLLEGEEAKVDDYVYVGLIYQTSRALEALGYSRGMSLAPIIKGFKFLDGFISKLEGKISESKYFVPMMDAICACYDIVSYEQSQRMLLPLACAVCEMAMRLDENLDDIHTQDIYFRRKMLERKGLGQEDLRRISLNIEGKIMKHLLKSIEWLMCFNLDISPRLYELLMDVLTNNFVSVFDVYKNEDLMYFISNTETLINIIHRLSDKKFAQFILDQATEYISDVLLPGVDDIYSATKLLLVTKILIESRAIIRR